MELLISKVLIFRLYFLRSAIPFCDKYCGSEICCDIIIENSNFDYNPSKKKIPKESLFFKTDTEKNSYLSKLTIKYYEPDSWYEFQERYYNLRIELTVAINKIILVKNDKITKIKFQKYLDNNLTKLYDLLKFRPAETPAEINNEFKELFKEVKDCFRAMINIANLNITKINIK